LGEPINYRGVRGITKEYVERPSKKRITWFQTLLKGSGTRLFSFYPYHNIGKKKTYVKKKFITP
jgi:hypothetical protein